MTEELIAITSPQEIIIGLPSLVLRLLPLFVDMLSSASHQQLHLLSEDIMLPPGLPKDELVEPWSQVDEEIAP